MVKARVLKRFNGMDAGTEFECPKAQFVVFHNSGLVEVVKEKKAPKTKEVKGPEVSK
jgi:hypothetical protein